jgi:hypothetical protein
MLLNAVSNVNIRRIGENSNKFYENEICGTRTAVTVN